MRPHGKWGDLLICLIPLSWCINILINSTFLLKMIEWQTENSLFTVRIRGRQWYWVYKLDLKDFVDITAANKNVGHNKIFYSSFGDLEKVDDYLHIVSLRGANKWLKKYWSTQIYRQDKFDNFSIVSFLDKDSINTKQGSSITYSNVYDLYFDLFKSFDDFNFSKSKTSSNFVLFNDFDESLRWTKRSSGAVSPLRLIKTPLNNYFLENVDDSTDIIRFRFNTQNTVKHKNVPNTNYYTFKQKRYKYRNKVLDTVRYFRDEKGEFTKVERSRTRPYLINNSVILNEFKNDLSKTLRLLQKNKKHDEFFSVGLYKRLLRTRRTLVIPAHVNITAITNSYDVVHSWFIPGLGLKLDCVPGRATHHTFYVDNVGFYYGQCAEVCGRYHHHMPIKVCALPFEHFIIWWQSFGLTKLTFTNTQKKYNNYYNFRKFVW
jgi:heme/copper-type cytochrome/quinol oxidase subunit 2